MAVFKVKKNTVPPQYELTLYVRLRIDLILRDLLQSSVVSAPDNTVQSKLVSLINVAAF